VSYDQITFGDSTFTFRYEFPDSWDSADITTVKIQIADENGTEILAATAATLYTATTLNAAVSVGDTTATLAAGASALNPGDCIQIADSDTGPPERRVVHSWNNTSKVVTVKKRWGEAHSSGTAVAGCWATYQADVSDSDDFAKGAMIVVTWSAFDGAGTPTLAYTPQKEMYQVGAFSYSSSAFWEDFKSVFPAEYTIAEKRDKAQFLSTMTRDFNDECWKIGKQVDRIVNQRVIDRGLRLFVRKEITGSGGDQMRYEHIEVAMPAWEKWILDLQNAMADWQDRDQDGAIDPEEVGPRPPVFDTGYY
jgi:hypothetical protein